jgi:VanZ family protein
MRSPYRQIILGLYVLAVLLLMLAPVRQPRMVRAIPDADKMVHAALFGLMAAIFWWNLGFVRRGRAVWAVALATAFACVVEVLQTLVPYRSPDPLDAVAGLVGAMLVAFVVVRVAGRGDARRAPEGLRDGKRETGTGKR